MFQYIEGKRVYIVQFDTMPELPIRGLTEEEQVYEDILTRARGIDIPLLDVKRKKTSPYAIALTQAIETGLITEPGKYAIHLDGDRFEVFAVNDEENS